MGERRLRDRRVARGWGFFKARAPVHGGRRTRAARLRLVASGLAALAASPGQGFAQAPHDDWRAIETEHFRVTFPMRLEALGRRAADRAERAYVRLTEEFSPPPGGRIDVLVTDHTDRSNGLAGVNPSNRITVFAAPPVDDLNLGYYDEWMELVVTHELAHIFHLDRTGTPGRLLRAVFGRVPSTWPFFPDRAAPRWTVEGLATFYESRLTGEGRMHGTFQETMLRTAVLEGRFEEVGQASGESPVWPDATRAYTYGSHFFEHLLDKHGEERMATFADAVAGQWIPYRLDTAGRRAFGAAISEEWDAWYDSLSVRYATLDAELERMAPPTRPERLTPGSRLALYPKVSRDGTTLAYARADGRSDTQLRTAAVDGSRGRERARTNGLATFDWLPGGDVLFSQLERDGPYRTYGDLYRSRSGGGSERLTRGERLSHPSASPDGRWAVAVRSGEGSTTLVRVDLATGEVRELVAAKPDVHWTFPSVSPDGRWIAASRWTPGAFLDVVLLDAEGREVARLTRDRALDLAPAWSPDGRWLVWGSDRTGIQNVLGARIDPGTGEPGPVRLVTNVRTGVAYPSVDPTGRWLYVSGYHVDGWEVERTPFDPDAWPEAPLPAARFHAPEDVAASGSDPAGRPLPAPPPPPDPSGRAASAPVRGYSPLPTLRPRYWQPSLRGRVRSREVTTSSLRLRRRELLGPALGAETAGTDLVGRHLYTAFGRVFTDGDGRADLGGSWSWSGLGNPILSAGFSQFWNEDGPRVARREDDAPLDTLFVLQRDRTLTASATFLRSRVRNNLSVTATGGLSWEQRDLLGNDLEPTRDYELTRAGARLRDLRLTVSWSSARSHPFQLGRSEGVSVLVRARRRTDLSVPDSLEDRAGADRSLDDLLGRVRVFHPVGGPGFSQHVIALQGSFGRAWGPDADAGTFDVGGAAGEPRTLAGVTLFGGSPRFFPVRGYDTYRRFGRTAWAASAEYRVPLALVHRGLGTWPFHLDRTTGGVFFDTGNAWGPTVDEGGFRNPRRSTLASVGAELVAGVLTFWTEPLDLRIGVAQPLVEGGGARAYLRLGLAF